MNKNTNKKSVKTGGGQSGRTTGSFSFISLPLSELMSKLNDPNKQILLPKKYADMIGVTGATGKAIDLLNSVRPPKPAKIEPPTGLEQQPQSSNVVA